MPRRSLKYGWVPDLPDHRDHLFSAPPPSGGLPIKSDTHDLITTVYDQGDLGSCTANAIGQAMMMVLKKQKDLVITPSRLFIYYNERKMEGSVNEDSGAQIRDGVKSVAQQGVCTEAQWPYDVKKFATVPPSMCYSRALDHQAQRYLRVLPTQQQTQLCLASGYPFVFGISVFESFESDEVARTGNVPMPQDSEANLGGHAIICIGYNNGPTLQLPKGDLWPTRTFLCQNSWGKDWGMKTYQGCFTIPIEYITNQNLADDFWTIRLVEG